MNHPSPVRASASPGADHAPAAWSRLERTALWFLASGVVASGLAWIAFQVQQEGIAPAVLFPLAVGGALGGSLAVLHAVCGAPRRTLAICVAGVLGLLVVAGQDYIGHRRRLRQFDAQMSRQPPTIAALAGDAALRPAWSEHLAARVRSQPAWWGLELAITVGAAAVATALGTRPGPGASDPPAA